MKRSIIALLIALPLWTLAQPPAGYYNSATGLNCSALKTALKNIIHNGFNGQPYGSLWTQYQSSDVKPREVGSGSAMVIWDIYSDNPTGTDPYNFTPITHQCGSYNSEADCYNREHSVPQSWFGANASSGSVGPESDYHHIFPTDGYVNGKRANYVYGEVATASWTSLNGSKLGSSAVAGITGTVFEPINEYKGDVARAFFYFVTMYQDNMPAWGTNAEAVQAFEPNTFPSIDIPYLKLMIKWHNQDPVSQKEIDRNNAAYAYQGNRNPFVDYPQYVNQVWNSTCPGLSALPVDVVLFTGQLNGNIVSLDWDVATEINLDRYEIERSFNGTDFSFLGKVKAENRSSYSFNDNVESVRGRRVYYRLKKVDKDGKFGYSAVFSVHVPLNTRFSVYPNPASSVIRLQLNNNNNDIASVTITDISGRIIYAKQMKASNGSIDIPTTSFGAGNYIVKLSMNREAYSQRVLVIK